VNERPSICALLVPPASVGIVLLTGASGLVASACMDLDIEGDYFSQEVAREGAGVTCVRADLRDVPADEVLGRIRAALVELVSSTPELSGWTPVVQLVEVAEEEEESEALEDEDISAEAERLLPTGEDLAKRLLHEIEHERSVYAAANRFRAFPVAALSTQELESLSPPDRTEALRRATALAGCLIHASEIAVEELFEDIGDLRRREVGPADDIDETWILSQLPSRFAAGYSARFAQQFLVALVDVTSRFTRGWEPLTCVAQELGLRVLLNQVEVMADLAVVTLDDDWRGHLEDMLFEDVDHEFLYDPAYDGIENDPDSQPPAMAPMRFSDWFVPFNAERSMPPYALPEAQDEALEP
jgi:hypothetical protein